MSDLRVKLGLTLASATLASTAGWWVVHAVHGAAAPVAFVDQAEELEALLTRRTGTSSNVTGRGTFTLEPIDEATARTLFVIGPGCRFDPLCYYRYEGGMERRLEWPEHPQGHWLRRTNAAGLREDGDATLADADLAVLVTGDSHTDGACNNEESFANLLEGRLRERHPDQRVEVLNAGVVGYSFYNYLGVLREFIDQEPDVFVVAVYGGNDFKGALRAHHYFRGTLLPPRRRSYYDKIQAATQVSKHFLAQSLSQVLYFQEYPDQIDLALDAALVTVGEIRRACAEAGARLVIVYIPPAYEASWPALDELTGRACVVLDVTEADLFVSRRLEQRFLDGLEDLGIDAIDMGPIYRAQPERCYWERDLHINLVGQRLIAEALDAHLAAGGGQLGAQLAGAIPDGPYLEPGDDGVLLVEGAHRDGLKEGLWIQRYPDGRESCRGSWSAGRRTGPWRWWYEDGTPKKSGSYTADQPDGRWVEWYRNGQLRQECFWEDARPTGTWREWREDGRLASEGPFVRGLEHGVWRSYHPGGALALVAEYRAGKLHGITERIHDNGQCSWRGRNVAGERVGPWEFWGRDGRPLARGTYERGQRSGSWTFWTPAGEVDDERSGLYVEGRRVR